MQLVRSIVVGCIMCLNPGLAFGGSPASPIPYVITPMNRASGRMLMMNPKSNGDGWGRCVELQMDGSLMDLWSINWYALSRSLFLHVGGNALLRVHEIHVDNQLAKQDYSDMIALTFYCEGKISKEIRLRELVPGLKKQTLPKDSGPYGYIFVKQVQMLDGVAPAEVGLSNLDEKQIHALLHEDVFAITTSGEERVFYTSKGEAINRCVSRK